MARIEHFAIFADDLEVLKSFYVDAFGLRVVLDNSRAPIRGFFLADDHATVLEIIERPPSSGAGDTRYLCHVAVWVDDYAKAKKAIEARGIAFESDTEVDSAEVKTGFFRDPDGNRCQIVWRATPLTTR